MSLPLPSILFISRDNNVYNSNGQYTYASAGLSNSAKFLANALNDYGYRTKVVSVTDSNSIDKEVQDFNADVIITEALFIPPYKWTELLLMPEHINRKWYVRIHSKFSFLSTEGIATKWISDYVKLQTAFNNFWIASNSKEDVDVLSKLFKKGKFVYLPNVYNPELFIGEKVIIKECDEVHIGLFGAVRPFKNFYTQAIAAILFAEAINKKLVLYMNPAGNTGKQVMKNIKALFENEHKLVIINWLEHKDFLNLVKHMDYGLQVSFTETFNIVSADFVHMEVPIIVSNEIDWLNQYVNPTSVESIVNALLSVHNQKRNEVIIKNKQLLSAYNYKSLLNWMQVID